MGTDLHDLVLIHISETPAVYARLECVEPDRKPGWWRVKLLILTLPAQEVTWILQKDQIDGKDFTIGGTPMRLEKITGAVHPEKTAADPSDDHNPGKEKVVLLSRRRKKR